MRSINYTLLRNSGNAAANAKVPLFFCVLYLVYFDSVRFIGGGRDANFYSSHAWPDVSLRNASMEYMNVAHKEQRCGRRDTAKTIRYFWANGKEARKEGGIRTVLVFKEM